MDARSPWEHIGGALILAALIFCFYGEWTLVALSGGVGSICIWLGWREYQRQQSEHHEEP